MEIIHIVLGKANPDRLNGVNKVVYNMATEQSKAGKNVQVWGITSNPVHDYPKRNFRTVLFQESTLPFMLPSDLKEAFLKQPNAVFHIHGGWVPLFSSIAKFLSKHNIRYVLTPHGAYNEVAMMRSGFRKKIYFQLFEKSLLKYAHKVHSIGASEVEGLSKIYPNATSFLLPYGFDAAQSFAHTPKNHDFTIGFVGRLDTHTKGLDLLMKAFEIFQKQKTNSKLWIIGAGEGEAYIKNFIQEKQLNNVVLWGKKFGEEKDKLIAQMHVFAHPSRNEGLPTAVLEAAVNSTPTIVTKATNVAEYVSKFKAGISIENNDVDNLVEAMHEFFKAYQTNNIGQYTDGAKNMLDEVFAWPKLVEQYDELYR